MDSIPQKGMICRQLCLQRRIHRSSPKTVLDRINATFPAGRLTLVTGPTGAGKTSLLATLAGLLRPTTGEIWSDGQPVSRWLAAHLNTWRRQVGIVFQDLALMGDLSVQENVMLPLVPRRIPLNTVRRQVRTVLGQLDLLDLAGHPVSRLSGGQRQRTAVARALAVNPTIVLADEPTANQDDPSAQRIMELLAERARKGAVVIVAAHDRRVLTGSGWDRHAEMKNGRFKEIV